jgi:succinyldiaminopimelate transaminase
VPSCGDRQSATGNTRDSAHGGNVWSFPGTLLPCQPMKTNPVLDRLGAYPIATVHERARALRDAGKQVIDFSIGDPRERTPAFIPAALKAAVPVVSQYPTTAGLPELRQAIAAYLGRRFSVTVDPDTQVIPTSGSKEAVFSTPFAFVDRDAGDVVVYGTPGYPIYERGALFAGAEIAPVRLGGDFVMRPGDVPEAAWDRAKLVWTCSPHNPTGAVTDMATLGEFVARCRDVGAWFLADECYADVYEAETYPHGPPSALQVAGDGAEGVLVYYSCSKRSGMTGYRSGAIIGDARAITALKKLRTATGTASPEFVQAAAVAAWSDDAHAAERRKIFAAKRATLLPVFDELGYQTVASAAGLYMWIKVGDDLAVTDRLLDGGVVVSPGRFFGAGGEGFIRLALVPTIEECAAAVEEVRKCLTG